MFRIGLGRGSCRLCLPGLSGTHGRLCNHYWSDGIGGMDAVEAEGDRKYNCDDNRATDACVFVARIVRDVTINLTGGDAAIYGQDEENKPQ